MPFVASGAMARGQLPVLFLIVCAGNIPSYAFLEGKAFRHGDIEDALAELIKKSGGFLGRGTKFGGLDIKRVYFGNWLRDYSQAMDIAGLTKLSKQSILNLVMALGFLAHGYATGEFEVTDERLGVYLPTEHIDNPKGYAADQPGGDARRVDPHLRPPVQDVELQIDPHTGMKNYIANENGNWDTSSRLVRERILQCIDFGRRARNGGGEAANYEAYRLLGTFLHTLEDFSAHSNWCELSLLRLGYTQVFCHVGDAVRINSPSGQCPPLVTGSFGGSDFIHSLLGEATDHISEASVSDLQKAMDGARSTDRGMGDSTTTSILRSMLGDLPGSSGTELSRDMSGIEDIRNRAASGQMDNMSPQELHATLWKVLMFRDNVMKGVESTIEKIPGLSALVEKIGNSLNAFVMTTVEPMLKPLMSQATKVLGEGSAAVINSSDQYATFTDPHASDPTHSFLSKDHFALILNEPAGQVAVLVLKHAVGLVVKAWDDTSMDPNAVASQILQTFHHPYFVDGHSEIQNQMGAYMKSWIEQQSANDKQFILKGLTKDAVRNHKNKRRGHESDQEGHGAHGHYNSVLMPQGVGAFAQQYVPGAGAAMNTFGQAQHTFAQVQHSLNTATSGQWSRRDVGDGFQEPQPGYMPPPGAPPQAVHGGAPDFNEFQPHTSSGYPGPPQPMYNTAPPQSGYGQPTYGQPGGQSYGSAQSYYAPGPQGQYGPPPGQGQYGQGQYGPSHGQYGGPGQGPPPHGHQPPHGHYQPRGGQQGYPGSGGWQ
ncbi:hypothetical protein BMF94_5112 [Rhodotorula taiwanensis]|uniref:Heterokaryon incompatibility Het-C n=1 Tax=Rhodotorula taiwanensis TaxID=741276 RepID=A0A2S5B4W6_9BASI|nr:hypothetical protein BMF94_5112 [Rhodotorula taiwanensis]